MEYESEDEKLEAALHGYKEAMAICAIRHLDGIDVRTLTALQRDGILEKQAIPENNGLILDVLRDESHPLRVKAPVGPLLFHKAAEDKPGRSVANVADLLFRPDKDVREAAHSFMMKLDKSVDSALTPRTAVVLEAQAEKLLSNDTSEWRTAAVTAYDLLRDDWLCNLAATRQCLAMDFLDGANRFFTAVMRPTVSSVESIMKCVWAATEQKEQIEKTIMTFVDEAQNLPHALSLYYDRFGHLPLANMLSVNRLIDDWEKTKGKADHLWELLWEWADSMDSPLPRYHACCAAIMRPDRLGDKETRRLLQEIREIVAIVDDEDVRAEWNQAWRIRGELTRHFMKHLESRLPGADSERITSHALWLAEQTSLLFGVGGEGLLRIRKDTVAPEISISTEVWHFSRPPLRPSRLRYATSSNQSVWSLSLLCQIGPMLERLQFEDADIEALQSISLATFSSLSSMLTPTGKERQIYAFDETALPLAKKLFAHWEKEGPQGRFRLALDTIESIQDQEHLSSVMANLPTADEDTQLLIASALRHDADTSRIVSDALWTLIQNREWWGNLMLKGTKRVVEMICDGLSEVQVNKADRWSSDIPHMLAYACECSADDAGRMTLLFALTMRSSMISDSVSAIQRLLQSEHRSKLSDDISFWRNRLETIRPYCPGWVKGRIRATLARLNSV